MSLLRSSLRELPSTLRLAAPITAGHVGQMLMGVADTIMVGHVSTESLAACAFAGNVINVLSVAGFGVMTSVSIRVSHAHGAGSVPAMSRALRAGIGLALIGGLFTGVFFHLVYPLFYHLGQDPKVVGTAQNYLLIVGWSLLPAWLTTAGRNYLEARSHPWPAFWIMMGGVLLNVVLNGILIFGLGPVPAMGLTGAGWATLLSRTATALALGWLIWRSRHRPVSLRLSLRDWRSEHITLFRLGLPAGLQLLCEIGAFTIAALLIGKLGAVPLAAHQIAITCAATTFMFPLGVSVAATVRVAQAVGGKRTHLLPPIAVGSWAVGLVVMGLFAMLFLTSGEFIARLFVREHDVVVLAAHLLVIAGIFQLVDGIQVIGSGLLRGLRETLSPMVITVAAYWFVALPLGGWLMFSLHEGASGMWIGLAAGLAVAAALLVVRFVGQMRRGRFDHSVS
jgi:MATE family multidrug resistance protein